MNPNAQDTPEYQQVMSPRAATGQGREVQSRTTVMNGVRPPLRGHQDLDDEVRAPGEGMGQMAHTPGTPPPGRTGGAQTIREATTNNLPGSGFLVGPGIRGQDLQAQAGTVDEASSRRTAAQGVILTEVQGRAHVEGPNAGGVLTGVLRAVQTLPAAVEEIREPIRLRSLADPICSTPGERRVRLGANFGTGFWNWEATASDRRSSRGTV